ncbi:AraC family transcriptional regulator [Rhodovastum atsumiense]|uniref:AraC family transcriptional regulator n=1 Tax=Rhodovastum atsumiense TaxID=504468 RepID=A0A5M6IRA6_9PROT|nr:AraC family transcriptional regulator [Rhodovastum atsumiense]KAA5610813.1 AraC family transcriptional regulator [Rhodovastum atsumiense]CAH2602141.1 AraC family transcriptional regulator [Rhodovastum atsumiense]
MPRERGTHHVQPHGSAYPGVEAVTLASDRAFPRHAHDQFGLGVLSTGAQRSWSGIGPVEAGPGDIITVNPGEMHDGVPMDARGRHWRMLYFDPPVLARALHDEILHPVEITRPVLRDTRLAGRFARLFAAITAPAPDRLAVEEEMLRTLALLLRRHGARRPPRREPPPCIRLALRRLDAAPDQPASLAELAALAGVSRFQLLRGFVRDVGITPYAYLLQRRVGLARQLLKTGLAPAEAAAAAGFADQSHMTRAFVRQFGVTPARYRAAVMR